MPFGVAMKIAFEIRWLSRWAFLRMVNASNLAVALISDVPADI